MRALGATLFAAASFVAAASASPVNAAEDSTSASASASRSTPPTHIIRPRAEELEAFQLPQPESDGDLGGTSLAFRASGWGMIAASAADVATTEWALSRGLAEGNPLALNRTARLVQHIVGPAAVWYTTRKLQQSGRKKLALSLRIALMAAYSYAALHNSRQIGDVTR